MSIFNDKKLKNVAEAAAKIMAETSHGSHPKTSKEKSLAALAHPKDKITHKDVLVGRGVLKKEDVELDEAAKKTQSQDDKDKVAKKIGAALDKAHDAVQKGRAEREAARAIASAKYGSKMNKEEVEQLDEVGDTPAGRKALSSYVMKALNDKNRQKGLRKATSRLYKDNYYGKKTNEEVEQLQEYESKDGVFKHKAKLEKGVQYGETDWDKEEKEAKKMSSPKRAQKGYGARQNYVRGTSTGEKKKVNEELSFTEMLELYNEHGLKVLAPIETEEMDIDGTTIEVIDADKVNGFVETTVEEEVTNDQFTKEFEDQKASFEGKKPQPKVAAGKTTGVKNMPEEYEQLDELSKDTLGSYVKKATTSVSANSYRSGYVKGSDTGHNLAVGKKGPQKDHSSDSSSALGTARKRQAGIGKAVERLTKEEVELDERTLTKGEAETKEKYVKGMKKKLSGFKQRYGERAKSVLYATATSMAKKKS